MEEKKLHIAVLYTYFELRFAPIVTIDVSKCWAQTLIWLIAYHIKILSSFHSFEFFELISVCKLHAAEI